MKLSIAVLAASASATNWLKRETEVQDAYFAGDDIVLSNPAARSNKQWHDCGEAPPLPLNARAVECSGSHCAAVCPIGWRSQGRWRIKCKADNTWAHSKFSPCVTCPDRQLKGIVEAVNLKESLKLKMVLFTKKFSPKSKTCQLLNSSVEKHRTLCLSKTKCSQREAKNVMSCASAKRDEMETLSGKNLVPGNSKATHGLQVTSNLFNAKLKINIVSLLPIKSTSTLNTNIE